MATTNPNTHLTGPTLIVKGSCGTVYSVRALLDPNLAHCWFGVKVRKGTGPARGTWVHKSGTLPTLVRRAAAKILQEIA